MAVISNQNLLTLLARVTNVAGDFVEVGVFRGDTFKRLAPIAHALGKTAHAFDSFQGMAPPTDQDFGHYPEGKLSVGGVAAFEKIMKESGVPDQYYRLWPGFIPRCFDGFDAPVSFALVDVDQYRPTLDSLTWIWPRLSANAILVLDDYFRKREGLAARAIEEWLEKQDPIEAQVFDYVDTQLYIKKQYIEPKPLPAHLKKG
jgi:Macrocin-O-methyltransferase (TylF)